MQNVLEQGPDFWCWFDKTQFSYHCVHPIHAKMFSIQRSLHFSQIALRVCTLVLFILVVINPSFFQIFMRMGIPRVTTTDNGTEFKNELDKELMKLLGVKRI